MPRSEAEHLHSNHISRHGCHEARSYCGSGTILGVERFKDLHCQLYHHSLAVCFGTYLSPELSLFY